MKLKTNDAKTLRTLMEAVSDAITDYVMNEKAKLTPAELNKRKEERRNAHAKDSDVRNADGNTNKYVNRQAQEVIDMIKDGPYTKAELMRRLWHPETQEEDDALRSLFSKKLNHKKNDDGVPYKFDKDEITSLAHILDTANS